MTRSPEKDGSGLKAHRRAANSLLNRLQALLNRPTALVAAASMGAAATAFLINILTARALGPELRGNVALVLQACYFISPALTLGADRGAVRSQGESTPPRPMVMVLLTLGVAGALAVFAPAWVWLAAPMALANAFLALNRADVLTGRPVRRFLVPFVGYQVFILGWSGGLFFLDITWWPAWALPYVLPLPFIVPHMLRRRHPQARTPWRSNGLLLVGRLAQLVIIRSQRLWLPAISGPAALGLFAVVATATEPLFWVAQALADNRTGTGAPVPRATVRAQLRRLARDCLIFTPLAGIGGTLLFFLIVPIFGAEFISARQLVLPLTIAGVILALYRQVTGWLLAVASERTYMRTELVVALFATGVYPLAAHQGGAIGAAWGSCIVYGVGGIVAMATFRFIHLNKES